MAKIYVLEGTKDVLKKIGEPRKFFLNELFLEHPPFFPYIMLTFKITIYSFSKIIREVLHS